MVMKRCKPSMHFATGCCLYGETVWLRSWSGGIGNADDGIRVSRQGVFVRLIIIGPDMLNEFKLLSNIGVDPKEVQSHFLRIFSTHIFRCLI